MDARALLADLARAGISVRANGDELVIRPSTRVTEDMRSAVRDAKPDLLILLRRFAHVPGALDAAELDWTDENLAAFKRRRKQVILWGWGFEEAERIAASLVRHDREPDDRVSCLDCGNYRPGQCGNHRLAGLQGPMVAREAAILLQRCGGFEVAPRPGD